MLGTAYNKTSVKLHCTSMAISETKGQGWRAIPNQ